MDFESSFEDIDDVTKKAKVTVAAEQVAKEIDQELDKVSRSARIKGFRPGKAPKKIVEKLYSERVRIEVANRLISSTLHDLLKDSDLKVVGMPEIENTSFEAGEDLTYTASLSLFPEPEIKDYEKFKVKVVKLEAADEDVEKEVKSILESKATLNELKDRDVVQEGDVINASFLAKIEGKEQERPEPQVVGLGEGNIPDDLEKGLLGMKIGESKEIAVTMPADHPNQKLRGESVSYLVELKSISEKELPELTDQFVSSLDREEKTVIELKMGIRKHLEEYLEVQSKERVHEAVLEELLKTNQFPVPQVLLDEEIRSMLVKMGLVDPQKMDVSKLDVSKFRKDFHEPAIKRARIAIMVDRLAEIEKLTATDEDMEKYAENVSKRGNIDVAEVKKWLLNQDRKSATIVEITRNNVLDFLEKRAEIEYISQEEKDKLDKEQAEKEQPASEEEKPKPEKGGKKSKKKEESEDK